MTDLLKAIQIFLKYGDESYPFHCEHDTLYVCYDGSKFSAEDIAALNELGFHWDGENFYSFKYGSC